ncbi:MAG: restriction endonuclease [Amaricoccus sp.]
MRAVFFVTSAEFEQLVQRVFLALEATANKVTWNPPFVDPDTGQTRQIDVEILRPDGATVHVECRFRGRSQDVQWVEELIGRRHSLQVDGMMAVSANGFTEPAYEKAKAYGIQTWDLPTLFEIGIDSIANPPPLLFPVFRMARVDVEYKMDGKDGDSAWEIANIVTPRHMSELRLFDILAPTMTPVVSAGQDRSVSERVFDTVIVRGNAVERITTVRSELAWTEVIPDAFRWMRKGRPEENALEAAIYIAEFSGVEAEVIFSKEDIRISIDLKNLSCPKGGFIGNHIHIPTGNIPGKRVWIRMRLPDHYQIDFAYRYCFREEEE